MRLTHLYRAVYKTTKIREKLYVVVVPPVILHDYGSTTRMLKKHLNML